MPDLLIAVLATAGAFLIGSIPFAYVVGRVFFQADIREHGSGNVGATNVFRVFGVWPALLVASLDIMKGFIPVAAASIVSPEGWSDWLMISATLAAVLGHSYTPWLGLSGGKGVATVAGALLRLTPWSVLVLLPVFVALVVTWRIVSLGSVVIALLYPVSVLVFYSDRPPVVAMSVAAAALVLWRHKGNMGRILRGEEKRIRVGRWGREPGGEGDEGV